MKTLNESLKFGKYLLMATAVSFAVTSCNQKDTDEPDNTSDPASNPPTPTFADGDGALTAVKSVTFQDVPVVGQVEVDLGLGVAVFFDNGNTSSFVEAGSVTLEGEGLDRQDNNSYVYLPSQTSPTGIDFSGNPNWEVTGNGSVGAFTHQTSIGFPSVGSITSGTTVTSGSPYTLTVANVSGADSVFFMCGGVIHTRAGNTTSHTFTADETSNMGSGPSYVQVAPYRIEEATVGGGDYWFVNERVVTQSVTIE
jgi:hypothetical protein